MHEDNQNPFNAIFTFLLAMLLNGEFFFDVPFRCLAPLDSFSIAALAYYIIILYANVQLVHVV